jgi:hypothetical protein
LLCQRNAETGRYQAEDSLFAAEMGCSGIPAPIIEA